MVFFVGRRLFGAQAGWYAALVLGSSLLWVLIGHVNTLDMGVSFLLSAAVCAFCLAQSDAADLRARADAGCSWPGRALRWRFCPRD